MHIVTEKSVEDCLADPQDAAWMLTARRMFTEAELVAKGGNPKAANTLRLCTHDGIMFPAFQFDEQGQLLKDVATINRTLLADEDPLGAAAWWLDRGYSADRSANLVNADLAAAVSLSWILVGRAEYLANGEG